jgi:hypothetical protein
VICSYWKPALQVDIIPSDYMSNQARKVVVLGPQHQPTGKTTHWYMTEPVPTPRLLRIVQYDGDVGFYLLYCDNNGDEMADTYHVSMVAAMSQAEFEFGVKPTEWQDAFGDA